MGGYLRTRHVNDVTYIDYLADYTGVAQQTVEYGKNLLSLEDGIVGGDIITVLLPYGGKPDGVDTRTTIESVNNGKSYIKADAETIAKYRNIWGTQTWDEITDPGQLLLAAQSYLNAQKEALNTVSAEALDLSAVDADMKPIYVGDYVRIISTPHGINKKLLCTSKTTDLADPASTRITIGPKTQTLTSAVKTAMPQSAAALLLPHLFPALQTRHCPTRETLSPTQPARRPPPKRRRALPLTHWRRPKQRPPLPLTRLPRLTPAPRRHTEWETGASTGT